MKYKYAITFYLVATVFVLHSRASAAPREFSKTEYDSLRKVCPVASELKRYLRDEGELYDKEEELHCETSKPDPRRPDLPIYETVFNLSINENTGLIQLESFEIITKVDANFDKGFLESYKKSTLQFGETFPKSEQDQVVVAIKELNQSRKIKLAAQRKLNQERNMEKKKKDSSPQCVAAFAEQNYCTHMVAVRSYMSLMKQHEKNESWKIGQDKGAIASFGKLAQEANSQYQKATDKSLSPDGCEIASLTVQGNWTGEAISGPTQKRLSDQIRSACGHD